MKNKIKQKQTSSKMTRSEAQRISNYKYSVGEISEEEWNHQFDEMSNVRIWNEKGKTDEGDN
jgi:uncharacterized membrane protein